MTISPSIPRSVRTSAVCSTAPNAQRAATLTLLEVPNLIALLAQVARGANPEWTVDLATSLLDLLKNLGRPQLLARVGEVRDDATAQLDTTWNQARFNAALSRVQQELDSGQIEKALAGAHKLLEQARTAGEHAYPDADYHLAIACLFFGRVLKRAGGAQPALPYLEEAQQRFEAVEQAKSRCGAARMASVCLAERGDCLTALGRLDEAAADYEENIRRAQQLLDERQVAVGKRQLGTVRLRQHRHKDALARYTEARDLFNRLGEPGAVASAWHQIGIVHRHAGQSSEAEDAYRQSLAISVQLGDIYLQASTTGELGTLYMGLGRLEEAASHFGRCADDFGTLGDARSEGVARNNLADTLCKLRRWDEARQEIQRAFECKEGFGHAAEPWKTWGILANIEAGAGCTDLAAQAKSRARECYLAYRRDGGENHNNDGRIALAVTELLLAGEVAGVMAELDRQLAGSFISDDLRPFVVSLRAIVAGNRDRGLADASDLFYASAAELLLLIDTLEAAAAGAA